MRGPQKAGARPERSRGGARVFGESGMRVKIVENSLEGLRKSQLRITRGRVPEWSNGAVSKTAPSLRARGFESHPFRSRGRNCRRGAAPQLLDQPARENLILFG